MADQESSAGWLSHVFQVWGDLRYAVRSFLRAPGFTLSALITLALGIGLNTAIFSVVHTVLVKPLPYPNSERLVRLVSNLPPTAASNNSPTRVTGSIAVSELLALRGRTTMLSHAGLYAPAMKTMTGGTSTARLEGWRVEPVLFHALSTQPLLGRLFMTEEAVAGADAVVLLSYGIWQERFGGDASVVGKTIVLDGTPHQVVGVMPAAFEFPFELAARQFWVPLVLQTQGEAVNVRLPMMARLAADVEIPTAVAEVNAILHDATRSATTYELVRVRDEMGQPVKIALVVLMGAVGFVLLIACVNVANLLLARTAARTREIAIRSSLGASRGRLVCQILTESLLLAFLGAIAGTLMAIVGIRALQSLARTLPRMDVGVRTTFPRLDEIGIDPWVLGFTVLAALFTGLLCGIVPAIRLSRVNQAEALSVHATSFSALGFMRRGSAGATLVVIEIAFAIMLLVGGGLLLNSFLRLMNVPIGYDPAHVLTFQVTTPAGRYAGQQIQTLAEDLVTRLRQVPGVQAAAYAPLLPMINLLEHHALFRRTPEARAGTAQREDLRGVGVDYFKVMGIPVIAGRVFTDSDGEGQPRVAVINRTLARRDFADSNAIGQMVYLQKQTQPFEIIGVVDDVRQVALSSEPMPQVFVASRQWPGMAPGLRFLQYYAVRTAGEPEQIIPRVREVVRQLDPDAAVYHAAPMEQLVANSISRQRLYAVIVGVFAIAALGLAAVGVFGMMAYAVTRRTREIGVRMALGATRRSVLSMVMRESMLLTAVGIVLGLIGGAVTSRYLRAMLFGVTPSDPLTFVGVSVIFVAVATLASYVPARRATRIDPLIALRED